MAQRGNVSYPMLNATSAQWTALRDLSVVTCATLQWYPFPSLQAQRRGRISNIYGTDGTTPTMQRLFGRLRAGATALPWPNGICPACNTDVGGTMHILSSCESTVKCRTVFLQNIPEDERCLCGSLTDNGFVKAIFDVEQMTKRVRRKAIKFVWNAIEAARQTAIKRRDAG